MDSETEILEKNYTGYMAEGLSSKKVRITTDLAEVEDMKMVCTGAIISLKTSLLRLL
jgi:hypothetical protein